MKERFSKMLRTAVLAVLLGTGVSSLSANVSDPCCYSNPCNPCNPCYNFDCCSDEPCFAFFGDLLVYNACQSDLDYAVRDAGTVATGPLTNSAVEYNDWDWHLGFRLGAAYRLCDSWNLEVIWTYWHPKHTAHTDAPIGGSLWPTQYPSSDVPGATATAASNTLKLHYDLIDVLVSRTYCCGDCFKLRPYAGVRTLLWQLKNKTSFVGTGAATSFATSGTDYASYDEKFQAVGFTLGARGKLHVCNGVSLIGHFGASILGNNNHGHQRWLKSTPVVAGTSTFRENRNAECFVLGEWDASIGLAYDFCCCNWPITLAVGYEVYDWWNLPVQRRFVDNSAAGVSVRDDGGRFTLHGAFFRAGVAF